MHTFYQFIHKLTADSEVLRNYSTINYNNYDFVKIAWANEYVNGQNEYVNGQNEYVNGPNEYKNNVNNSDEQNLVIRLIKIIFHMYLTNITRFSVENKFMFFNVVLKNPYLNNLTKEIFINKFSEIQNKYWLMNRFVRNYKFKKAQYQIKSDLILNPIRSSQHNVITILSNEKKYLFTVMDLKNIIESALINSPYFFSNPIPPKNPYNNLPFDKSTLYNIYFFMKQGNFVLSTLFHNYFLCSFNLNRFRQEHEVLIRKKYTDQYIKNMCENDLYDAVIEMLNRNKYTKRLKIDRDFPKKLLVSIMKPYLTFYYNSYYSLNLNERNKLSRVLSDKLRKFYFYNPKFGRKFVTKEKNMYNDICIKFTHHDFFKNYANSHLQLDDDSDDDLSINTELLNVRLRTSIAPYIIINNQLNVRDLSSEDTDTE